MTAALPTRTLTGWSRTAPTRARVLRPTDVDELARAVRGADERGAIARGLGRSYAGSGPERGRGGRRHDRAGPDPPHRPGRGGRRRDAYGSKGFLQYQFSIPFGREAELGEIMRHIVRSDHYTFLNVLKRMGESNPAPLSWPHPGWMLSVDFPVKDGLDRYCEQLDERVLAAGGRLCFAKDSRTRPDMIRQMYPRLDEWRRIRATVDPEGIFRSDLSRRLAL